MLNEDDLFNKEATAMDSAVKMAKKASQAANKSVKSITKTKTKTPKKTQKQRRTKKEKKEAETMSGEDKKMKQKPAKKTRAKKGEPKKPRKYYKDPRVSKRNRTTKPLPTLITGEYAEYMEAVKIKNIRLDKIPNYEMFLKDKLVEAYGSKANNWKNLHIYAVRFKTEKLWTLAHNYLEVNDLEALEQIEEWMPAQIEPVPTKKIFVENVYKTEPPTAKSGRENNTIYADAELFTVKTLKYNCGTYGSWTIPEYLSEENQETEEFGYYNYEKTSGDNLEEEVPIAGGFLGLEYMHHKWDSEIKPTAKKNKEGKYTNKILSEISHIVRRRPLPHPCLIVVNPEYNKVLIKFRQWDQITTSKGIKIIKEILYNYNYYVEGDNYDIIGEDILNYYDMVYRQTKSKTVLDSIKDDMVYFSDEED